MSFFNRFFHRDEQKEVVPPAEQPEVLPIDREIDALYQALIDLIGTDSLVIQAGRMNAMNLLRSSGRCERVLALQRILDEDPLLHPAPREEDLPEVLQRLTERIAEKRARKDIEDRIEKKVNEKLEQEHQDYVDDIRKQVIKEEKPDAESPQDAEKRKKLEQLDSIHLTQSVMELLRPRDFSEIVGQERAVKSLLAKLSSPYPQHLLLYGPPGVGKTTAARLVLEAACKKPSSPFREDAPSSRRTARHCAGTRATSRIRSWALSTTPSTRARRERLRTAASLNRSRASSQRRTAASSSSTRSARWTRCCRTSS